MTEIKSDDLDGANEGRPVVGPDDTTGHLDETHEGRPVVGFAFPTIFNLTIDEAYHEHFIDALALSQDHSLAIDELYHIQTSPNLTISETGVAITLTVNESEHTHTSATLILSQKHNLVVDSGYCEHSADTVRLTEVYSLVVDEISHAHSLDGLNITQLHLLTVSECYHAHDGPVLVLTQRQILVVFESDHLSASDNINLSGSQNLAVAESYHAHAIDGITIAAFDIWADAITMSVGTIGSGTLESTKGDDGSYLIIDEIFGAYPRGGFDIRFFFYYIPTSFSGIHVNLTGFYKGNKSHRVKAQAYNWTIGTWDNLTSNTNDFPSSKSDSIYSFAIDRAKYIQAKELRFRILHVSNGQKNNFFYIDDLRLIADYSSVDLGPSDSVLLQTADNIRLSQKHTLVVQDSFLEHFGEHAHPIVEVPGRLTVFHGYMEPFSPNIGILVQKTNLVISECAHEHFIGIADLVSDNTAIAEDSYHEMASQEIPLLQTHIVVPEESYHNQVADNLKLTEVFTLAVDSGEHDQSADEIGLSQLHSLTVSDSYHEHAAGALALTGKHYLSLSESYHVLYTKNMRLFGTGILYVNDCYHAHAEDGNLTLIQKFSLILSDAFHINAVDGFALTQMHYLDMDASHILHLIFSDNIVFPALLPVEYAQLFSLTPDLSLASLSSGPKITQLNSLTPILRVYSLSENTTVEHWDGVTRLAA